MIEHSGWFVLLEKVWLPVGIFLYFLILRKLFATYMLKIVVSFTEEKEREVFKGIFSAFEKPLQNFFIVLGLYLSLKFVSYMEPFQEVMLTIFRTFIVIFLTTGFFNLFSLKSLFFENLNEKLDRKMDQLLIPFLSRLARVVGLLLGFGVVAKEWDFDMNGLIAGLGIGGLALSLAAKDTLSNFFAGVVLIVERPFTIGDWIKTSAVEGVVEDINFRSTKVRSFDQALYTLPNSALMNEAIKNWTKMGKRRISFTLELAPNIDRERLNNVVKGIEVMLRKDKDIHQETIYVNFDSINNSGKELFLYFFTTTTDWGEYLKVKEKINYKIIEILEKEKVEVALPIIQLKK